MGRHGRRGGRSVHRWRPVWWASLIGEASLGIGPAGCAGRAWWCRVGAARGVGGLRAGIGETPGVSCRRVHTGRRVVGESTGRRGFLRVPRGSFSFVPGRRAFGARPVGRFSGRGRGVGRGTGLGFRFACHPFFRRSARRPGRRASDARRDSGARPGRRASGARPVRRFGGRGGRRSGDRSGRLSFCHLCCVLRTPGAHARMHRRARARARTQACTQAHTHHARTHACTHLPPHAPAPAHART